MNIAENRQLIDHPLYLQIKEVINELHEQNLITNGSGFCLAMSDIIHNMLKDRGIESHVAECSLTIVCTDPPQFHVVGLESIQPGLNQMSTHVVVVVDHEQPLLIDASISHLLQSPFKWVCALGKAEINEIHRDPWTLTYRARRSANFPAIHNRSIVERIKTDQKMDRAIQLNKILISTTAFLTLSTISLAFYNYQSINKFQKRQQEHTQWAIVQDAKIAQLNENLIKLQQSLIDRRSK